MNVLIFTTQFYRLSGAERLAVELAEGLNKRGIRAGILSMYEEGLPGVAAAKIDLMKKGIPSVHFLGMRVHPSFLSLFPAVIRLRRLIRENGYDVLETSSVSPNIIGALATWMTKTRLVHGVHEDYDRKVGGGWRGYFWLSIIRIFGRTRYYAVSESALWHWQEHARVSKKLIRMIYNSINDEFFKAVPNHRILRGPLKIPGDARIVLFVGRLNHSKGIDTVYDAMKPLLSGNDIFLLFSGWDEDVDSQSSGGKGPTARLREMIDEERQADRVFFLGHRNDIPSIMACSDILVHPARRETFGLVLVEAMATGLQVVSSNVGGIPEVLSGTESIQVPPSDPVALREAVVKVLNRTDAEARLAIESGRKRAQDFCTSNRIDAMIRFFDDVVTGRF